MIDKYEDFPNGISDNKILGADNEMLARILEIYTIEFDEAAKREAIVLEKYENQMEKFFTFSSLLVKLLRNWNTETDPLIERNLQGSIYIGSMLEAILQIFLFVFQEDFTDSMWKKWVNPGNEKEEIDYDRIRDSLNDTLETLQTDGVINNKQKNNLKDVIKNELKIRKNGRQIDRIMLDELIRFIEHEKIFEFTHLYKDTRSKEEPMTEKVIIAKMDAIKNARNNVHSFSNGVISENIDVIELSRDLSFIFKHILHRIQFLDETEKKNVFYEMLLEIPNTVLINVDDNDNIVEIKTSEE